MTNRRRLFRRDGDESIKGNIDLGPAATKGMNDIPASDYSCYVLKDDPNPNSTGNFSECRRDEAIRCGLSTMLSTKDGPTCTHAQREQSFQFFFQPEVFTKLVGRVGPGRVGLGKGDQTRYTRG